MLGLLTDLGAEVVGREAGIAVLDIPLAPGGQSYPDTPAGRVFQSVAKRVVRELEAPYPLLPSSPS